MSALTQLYRGETSFDFVAVSRRTLLVSAAAIVISVLALSVGRPLNLSIDFTGGTIVRVVNESGVVIEDVRAALRGIDQAGARVQLTGDGFIIVQTESLGPDDQDRLVAVVADVAGVGIDETNVSAVGPTFGGEVTRAAIQALVVFLIAVAVFITWRFGGEWKMALTALAALFHDLIITAGIYAIVGFVVTPATVIAVLTILGYSLYDTTVVYDKVTENVGEAEGRFSYTEIVNLSLNQVLMRSVNTSLTSLLPVGSLLFVGSFLLGADTLRQFALALFIGIAVGTYSSIFVAAPLLTRWKEQESDWQRTRRRAERRRAEGDEVDVEEPDAITEVALETKETGATPRPPRYRKKRR